MNRNNLYRVAYFGLFGVWLTAAPAAAEKSALKSADNQATLTSDEMELITKGNKAIFTGHVVLDRPPYKLRAKRMTRTEETGLVEAEGRVTGTWKGDNGAKLETNGDFAQYNPGTQIAELWTKPGKQVTVKWNDERGSGNFFGDKAQLFVESKTVRLVDHVTGHIVPAPKR